jgi:hypothetical protein
MAMTRRPTSTIRFVGLQATNIIGYYESLSERLLIGDVYPLTRGVLISVNLMIKPPIYW